MARRTRTPTPAGLNGHAASIPGLPERQDDLDDRLPLHRPDMERSVLGDLLIAPGLIGRALEIIKEEDFYSDRHQVIFHTMVNMHASGRSWDTTLIASELERLGQYQETGGDNYLATIAGSVVSTACFEEHAGWVKEYAVKRALQALGDEIAREAISTQSTSTQLLDRFRGRLGEIQPPDITTLKLTTSSELCEPIDPPTWLINGVLIAGQETIVGGPMKTLKTSILIDMMVSLGTGTSFLGRFPVPRPMRVALISGESGRYVIRQNAREMAMDRGVDLDHDRNILWGFDLPLLTEPDHLRAIETMIKDNGLEVLAIDPMYLTIPGERVDHANMFSLGPILKTFGKMCLDAGCMPILSHHFTKSRENPNGPPELHELAYGGVSQWMRQWCLVSRREPYDASTGVHRLHWRHGGSFGHSVDLAPGHRDWRC